MAVRPIYSATIKFSFDQDALKKSLANIEDIVRQTVSGISESASNIKTPTLGKVGALGGLSSTTVVEARKIRAAVRDAFSGLEGDIDSRAIGDALDAVADRMGVMADSIVSRLARMTDASGRRFAELKESGISEMEALYMSLVGRSIIPDLVDRIDRELSKLPAISKGPVDDLVDEFFRLEEIAANIDLTQGITAEAARLESDLKALKNRVQVQSIFEGVTPLPGAGFFTKELGQAEDVAKDSGQRIADSVNAPVEFIKDKLDTLALVYLETMGKVQSTVSETSQRLKGDFEIIQVSASEVADDLKKFIPSTEIIRDDVVIREHLATLKQVGIITSGVISDASQKLSEASKPAREFIAALGPKANAQIKETAATIKEFTTKLKGSFKSVESPEESIGLPDIRKSIALLEEGFTRLPDKSTAAFNELKRNFSEARSEAIKLQKAFDENLIPESALELGKNRLDEISKSLSKLQTSELERLQTQLERNQATVDITAKTFSQRMGNIRDGITLASETGGNKLLSLRIALFGVGEATGPVGRLLDRYTSNLDSVGKAQDRLSQLTVRITKDLASQNNALKSSLDTIKDVSRLEGLHAEALNDVDTQVSRVEKAYKDMTTTIDATGRATPQQVARVREEYRLLQESIRLVKIENQDAIGPKTLQALATLETQISRNVPATRVLATTLDTAATKLDKLRSTSKDTGDAASKNIGIFTRLKNILFGVTNATDNFIENSGIMNSRLGSIGVTAGRVGGILAGAFGGALIFSALGKLGGALSGLTTSISSQVQEATTNISNAFALMPEEAEVVSGAISDVYETGLGGSIDAIGDATQRVIARMRDLGVTSQEEISGVVEDAFRLEKAYGFDVPESIDAASVLMRQFNLSIDQSTDFLAKLGQEGVIGSDAIDSILEYSTQVKSAGGDATDLFNILRTGFAGGGTLGTDKALDLIKEYRLRISEGADATTQALNEIGINSTDLLARLSSGSISVLDSFEFVRQKLSEVDSETDKARLGALIMGTQFEDLGTQMALSISTAGVSLSDMAGATDNLGTTYTNLGAGMEAINRRIQLTLDPLKTTFINFAGSIIPSVLTAIDSLAPVIQDISARVGALINALRSGDWETAKAIVLDAFAGIADSISSTLDWLVSSAFDWGANFVVEIANGLIETASSIIVDAMNYIGDLIGSFMAPGSPPEKGPLSDIDKWGKGLMDTFGLGFKAADFRFVEEATRPIQDFFKKEFGREGFDAFEGIRNSFTEIVSELNTTGVINEDAFKGIADTIGESNTELTKMLRVQLDLKKAQKDLEDAQRAISDAEAAGFVSEGLRKKLKSAEQQVEQAKENVEWQKEFLKFQGLSEDSFGNIAKAAGNLGSAAAGGAARATKAIKDAAARQLEFINEGYDREKRLLSEKLDFNAISWEDFLKESIKLEEKYIEDSILLGKPDQEIVAHADALETLKTKLEEIQTSAKNARKSIVPLGEALIGGLDGAEIGDPLSGVTSGIEQGKAKLEGAAKSIGEGIATNIADGLLESARTRLSETFSKIGENITKLFREKILARLTPEQKQVGGIIGSALLGGAALNILSSLGLITSKLTLLAGVATRFTVAGTAVYLIWQNWDTITLAIGKSIDYLSGVWGSFTDKLGGSQATLATFSGIFTNIKDTLSSIGANLVDFVLDALEGQSVTLTDFINIFDFSSIDTEPIKNLAIAIGQTLQEELDKIKVNFTGLFAGAAEEDTRFGRIVANFARHFENIKQSFSDFGNSKLVEAISGLLSQLNESWAALSVVLIPIVYTQLPAIVVAIRPVLPQLLNVATAVGKVSIVFAAATTIIGNWEKIWPSIETTLAGIINVVSGLFEAYTGLFALFSGDEATRIEGFKSLLSGLTEVFFGIEEAVIGAGTAIAQVLINAISDGLDGIGSLLELIGADQLAQPFYNMATALDDVSANLTIWTNQALEIFYGLKDQVLTIVNLINFDVAGAFEKMRDAVVGTISELVSGVKDWFYQLWVDLFGASIVVDIVESAKNSFLELKSYIIAPISEAVEAVKTTFAEMKESILGAITSVRDEISPIIDGVKDIILAPFESLGISEALSGIFDGLDLSTRASALAISIVTPLYEVVNVIEGIKNDVLTGIGALKLGLGIHLYELSTGFIEIFDGLTAPVLTAITNVKDSVLTAITNMVTDGIASVTGFATDFIDQVLSIPGKIKERISEFADVGSLLKNAFGFGGEDLTSGIADEFSGSEGDIVGPVQSTTDKIKGAWDDAYNWVVGNSVVPDMVTGINNQFLLMSTDTVLHTTTATAQIGSLFTNLALLVQGTFSTMVATLGLSIGGFALASATSFGSLSVNVSTSLQSMQNSAATTSNATKQQWQVAFNMMSSTVKVFGNVAKQVLAAIDAATKKLTSSVRKLEEQLGRAKDAMDALRGLDFDNLVDAFKEMYRQVKKTRDKAKEFAKFMEAAAKSADAIGDTLGGNVAPGGVPGAQHGAWNIANDGLVYLHKNELVMPPQIAEDFRGLMVSLQRAGIGSQGFDIPMRSTAMQSAPGARSTVQNNYITAEFPGVTQSQEIVSALDSLIDDSRRFSSVGSTT